ncbi:MAG: hypothetical protein ABUT39_11405, partial [Acidobacteriota bacterium]
MNSRPLRTALLGGFLYGSLVYGLVLSLVHVVHNRLASPVDALLTWFYCALFYGLGGAAVFLVGYGLARLRRAGDPVSRGAGLGLFLYNLGFWELFWLHGLTYDQYPFGHLE